MTGGSPRFLVVAWRDDEWQTVRGARWYLHGGERYRTLANEALAPHGEVEHLSWDPNDEVEERATALDARLPDADALVMSPWLLSDLPTFDETRFGRAPSLRAIAGTFDFRLGWIDLDAAARAGVRVIDTSRSMTWTVAEFGLGITLALLRDIPASIDVVRRGEWPDAPKGSGPFVFRDLADCRVGLAGYGSINRSYRKLAAPFGCEVSACDPFLDDDTAARDGIVRADSLVDLAARSDILVVAIPPTPTTLGVIDAGVIDALPTGSLFVLVSRMAVVDQDALWRRVRAGELRAAVDVYDPEPPPADAWFRRSADVLPTPHIAGNVQFAHERCFVEACADAVRAVRGEELRYPALDRDKRLYEGKLGAVAERPTS
ncbi:MAG TPA: NAD(P)-dependent oxidoreductase [Actinomycetota bacterium]|jgi:phosphoglycerate dehydrogenase-like enzyme